MGRKTHERFDSDESAATIGSDRAFGIVFAVLLAAIGLWPLLDGAPPRGWPLAGAGTFLAVALVRAAWLAPLNRLWFRFGLLLQRIAHPVVLAIIYFAVVTPTGLVLRALGKDPLRLRRDPDAATYWIRRDPPGPEPESMTRQF